MKSLPNMDIDRMSMVLQRTESVEKISGIIICYHSLLKQQNGRELDNKKRDSKYYLFLLVLIIYYKQKILAKIGKILTKFIVYIIIKNILNTKIVFNIFKIYKQEIRKGEYDTGY